MAKKRLSHILGNLTLRWTPSVMWYLILVSSIFLAILIFVQVWLRYIFHLPLFWVEEVAIVPAFWLYMLGAAYGAYERSHIKVDILGLAIKSPRRQLLIRFITSVIVLGLAMIFVWWGYLFFTWDLEHNPQTYTLRFPMLYGRCSFFFAAGIIGGFYFCIEAIDLARQLFWKKAPLLERKE